MRDMVKTHPDANLVNEGANALDFTRSIVDKYQPRKRFDVRHLGHHGHRHGVFHRGRRGQRPAGDRDRRATAPFGFSGHGSRDHLPLQQLPVCDVIFQQQRRLQRHRRQSQQALMLRPPYSSRARATTS